jgi:hypothetical protein
VCWRSLSITCSVHYLSIALHSSLSLARRKRLDTRGKTRPGLVTVCGYTALGFCDAVRHAYLAGDRRRRLPPPRRRGRHALPATQYTAAHLSFKPHLSSLLFVSQLRSRCGAEGQRCEAVERHQAVSVRRLQLPQL